MKCENCGYWWKEDWEDHYGCHYSGPESWAPCEQDDSYYEGDNYELCEL